MNSIAFFDTKPYDREFFEHEAVGRDISLSWFKPHLSIETAAMVQGHDTVCAFVNDTIDAATVEALAQSGVTLIALRCAGYNNVDLKAVYRRIHVVRVPEYSPYAVAEHTLALMMALNRNMHRAYYRTRDMNFSIHGLLGFVMHGKIAGVIGTGKIGRVLIGILRGFGMEILAHDTFANEAAAHELGFTYTSLDDLYARSDIISLHCPLTPETLHLINAASIAKMKPGVMIINTGRGKLIDTRELIAGLKSRRVGAAGLDVYEEESEYFFEDRSGDVLNDDTLARLMTFPNVLVTSHQAFFTREALCNIARTTLDNIELFYARGELPNEVCYRCCEGDCARKTTGKCF